MAENNNTTSHVRNHFRTDKSKNLIEFIHPDAEYATPSDAYLANIDVQESMKGRRVFVSKTNLCNYQERKESMFIPKRQKISSDKSEEPTSRFHPGINDNSGFLQRSHDTL